MPRVKKTIEILRNRIEAAVRKPEPVPWVSLETVLLFLSYPYGALMRLRARLYTAGVLPSRSLPCPVVSIGNIIAGGTGKTPMTILVARRLQEMGCRVVVISRGYRGRMEATGGIVSDGRSILAGPETAGDEPYLMARILTGIPVLVGRHRHRIGMLAAERFQPDVVILDDAFQHMALRRDLDLVLLDARIPFANGHTLPRGLLREPKTALMRADAIVFTRGEKQEAADLPEALPPGCPVFFTSHESVVRDVRHPEDGPDRHHRDIAGLRGKAVLAFAGLADNRQFFGALETAGCRIVDRISFRDHYPYAADDLERICRAAKTAAAEMMVTSYKDFVKIENRIDPGMPLVAVDVTLCVHGDPQRFNRFLSEFVGCPSRDELTKNETPKSIQC
jgi:tetraacyldisaccharide 4'-kinase